MYALGIYVDVPAAKSALTAFKKKPAEELEKDQAFYDGTAYGARHLNTTSPPPHTGRLPV